MRLREGRRLPLRWMVDDDDELLLTEQVAYYRALAPEYLDGLHDLPGFAELEAALDRFAAAGDVLELACGPGTWTPRLLRFAATVTAVDASPEMLAIARQRVGHDSRVRFLRADLFAWRPDRRYDVVVFGFWLSHVPLERFAAFWTLVDDSLAPRIGASPRAPSLARARRRRRTAHPIVKPGARSDDRASTRPPSAAYASECLTQRPHRLLRRHSALDTLRASLTATRHRRPGST